MNEQRTSSRPPAPGEPSQDHPPLTQAPTPDSARSSARFVDADRKPNPAFSFLAGVLSILVLISTLLLPVQKTAAQQLAFVSGHQSTVAVAMFSILLWATFSVPFVVGLGTLVRSRGTNLALTATLLSAGGILLLGFGNYVGDGALLSIVTAGHAPTPGADIYQTAIASNLWPLLSDPGLMAWGLGQLMFAQLMWKSGILPDWLAVVAGIGGLATFLASLLLPTNAIPLALFALVCFSVLGFATGIILLRTRAS
jgi:hypothetical protein